MINYQAWLKGVFQKPPPRIEISKKNLITRKILTENFSARKLNLNRIRSLI